MTRFGMVVDISKCSGCYNCFLACKDEHCGHDFPGYAAPQPMTGHQWVRLVETERGSYPKVKVAYTPIPCMQCREAPCLERGEGRAVYRRADGIVMIDPVKARGQRDLLSSCPYRVIQWNEEHDLPQKCTFCAHLLDAGWKEPRCVELCPAGALTFGDLDDPQSEVSRLAGEDNTEVLHPEFQLDENVFYINLPKKFIAGSVSYADTDDCAVGATVTLAAEGWRQVATTDGFGDFEFEGLDSETEYVLRIDHPGYKPKELTLRPQVDVYLGDLALEAAALTH